MENWKNELWNNKLNEVVEFLKENGRLPKQKENIWVNSQRNAFNRGDLSLERIQLIENAIPNFFQIDLKYTSRNKRISLEKKINEVVQFVKEHGRLPKYRENYWVAVQRHLYFSNKLANDDYALIIKYIPNFFNKLK